MNMTGDDQWYYDTLGKLHDVRLKLVDDLIPFFKELYYKQKEAHKIKMNDTNKQLDIGVF